MNRTARQCPESGFASLAARARRRGRLPEIRVSSEPPSSSVENRNRRHAVDAVTACARCPSRTKFTSSTRCCPKAPEAHRESAGSAAGLASRACVEKQQVHPPESSVEVGPQLVLIVSGRLKPCLIMDRARGKDRLVGERAKGWRGRVGEPVSERLGSFSGLVVGSRSPSRFYVRVRRIPPSPEPQPPSTCASARLLHHA